MFTAHIAQGSSVFPDVNPGVIVEPLKLPGNRPYSGIEKVSQRAVFVPLLSLLSLLLLFE